MKNANPVVEALTKVLADSYALMLRTQNYHWNVEGPQFRSLHLMFEEQYTDLQKATDEIAERIRAIGAHVPGGLRAFADLTSIADAKSDHLPARDMIAGALEGQRAAAQSCAAAMKAAEKADDQVTQDMMVERITVHDKNAWMLQAQLGS